MCEGLSFTSFTFCTVSFTSSFTDVILSATSFFIESVRPFMPLNRFYRLQKYYIFIKMNFFSGFFFVTVQKYILVRQWGVP